MSTELLNWITDNPPIWASQTILDWDDIHPRGGENDIIHFITRETFENNATIDMREVIGQWDHYAGQTWRDAALNPQYKDHTMLRTFKEYQANPDYYFNGELGNGICLSRQNGGPAYSVNGGNHRTVVAKFACAHVTSKTGEHPFVRSASCHHYLVDMESRDIFTEMLGVKKINVFVRNEEVSNGPVAGNHTIVRDLKFDIWDCRFTHDRRGLLSPSEFRKYATYVLENNGIPSRWDWVRHFWHNDKRLIYPGGY